MKKMIFPIACFLLMACGGQNNPKDTEGKDSIVQGLMDNSLTENQGGPKTIKVKGGGQAPNVMTLLKAFNEAMPMPAVAMVLEHGEKLADGAQYESDDDWRVLVDRKNGYADLVSQTDIDQMQAAVWKRKNGHRLFGVSLFQQHNEPQNRLCWYDYDPATETMTAERGPEDDFKPDLRPQAIDWYLPMHGTTFELYEYHINLPRITHQYTWDGQQFHPGKTLIDEFRGSAGDWNYYAIIDVTGAGSRVLWLSKDKNPNICELFTEFKGEMHSIAELSEQSVEHSLGFTKLPPQGEKKLPTAIVTWRDLAGGYWHTVFQGDYLSYIITDLPNFAGGGGRSIDIEGFGAPDETTDILNEEGEPFTPTPQWHKFEFQEEAP